MSDAALERLRGRLSGGLADASKSRYADILRDDDAVQRLIGGDWPMEWSDKYYFASDDPLKATMAEDDSGALGGRAEAGADGSVDGDGAHRDLAVLRSR